MSNLYALGLPCNKLCVFESNARMLNYKDVDLSFADRQWSGWYTRLPDALALRALDHLVHKITRSPRDLSVHVHRIHVASYLTPSDLLYGALLDLFYVLDRSGIQLRQRMLNKFDSLLTTQQQLALRQGLIPGIKAVDELPQCRCSHFTEGLVGYRTLVVPLEDILDAEFNVLDEARDLIDAGFVEEARMILEEAVLQQPDDEALNRELLGLYRYTRNVDAFLDARRRFEGLDLALNKEWQKLADILLMAERVSGW